MDLLNSEICPPVLRWHCYNTNYLPYSTGLHKAKKTEGFAEFVAMHPNPPEEFLTKLVDAARDANVAAPSNADEEFALYEAHVLNNPDWKKKGVAYRPDQDPVFFKWCLMSDYSVSSWKASQFENSVKTCENTILSFITLERG